MCLIPQTEPVGEDKAKILSTNKNRISISARQLFVLVPQ